MAIIGFERAPAPAAAAHNVGHLTVPTNAHRVQLQAQGANIRYTMNGVTVPTAALGMLLVANAAPEWFEREDLANILFIGVAAGAFLNIHYYGTTLP